MMGDEVSVLNLSWKDIGNLVGDVVYGARSWIVFQTPFLRGCLFFPFFLLLFCFLFNSFLFPFVFFVFFPHLFLFSLLFFFLSLSRFVQKCPWYCPSPDQFKGLPTFQKTNERDPEIHSSKKSNINLFAQACNKNSTYIWDLVGITLVFFSGFHKLCILRFV